MSIQLVKTATPSREPFGIGHAEFPACMQSPASQNKNLRLMSEVKQCFSKKKYY